MKRILAIAVCACSMFVYSSCVTNAVTGRSQLSLVSESDLQSMALVQYKNFLQPIK